MITVPALFDAKQTEAVEKAAQTAGINCLHTISDTYACATAQKFKGNKTILVLDFGGCNTEASLVQFRKGEITVEATSGDTDCGGR